MNAPPQFTKPSPTQETDFKLTNEERVEIEEAIKQYGLAVYRNGPGRTDRSLYQTVNRIEEIINKGWQTC